MPTRLIPALALCALATACPAPSEPRPPPTSPPAESPPEYPALSRVSPEPPGAHCRHGGSQVFIGLDRNRDGVLDDSEVTSSQYLCDAFSEAALHVGNLLVRSSADLARLEGIEYLVGDLFLRGDLVPEVHLPRLQRVTGSLTVGWEYLVPLEDGGSLPAMSTLRLPALRSVGNLLLTLPYVQTLELPALESVGDLLELTTVGQLTAVELPALRSVGGDFSYHYTAHFDASPQALRAPLLASVSGTLALDHNARLATVELPALAEVGGLSVQGNASLTALALPALSRSGALTVSQNEALATLSLPKLGAGAGATLVTANPALSECRALELEVARRSAGYLGAFLREGNAPDTACARNTASTCVPLALPDGASPYALCYVAQDAAQAASDCASVFPGGHLATFETRAEFQRVQEAVKAGLTLPVSAWLGYSDAATEGTFQWAPGGAAFSPQAGDTTFWSPGEPNDAGGEEDCVMLLGLDAAAASFVPGYASDTVCARPHPALCEKP